MAATPTSRESAAAHRLAEAIVEFLLAIEAGRANRMAAFVPAAGPLRGADEPPPPSRSGIQQQLLHVRDAAEYLGICPRNVARLTAPHGPLPCVRLGRRVCYARGDLEAFIKAQTVRA